MEIPRDTLDTTTASQAADGGLRDALDVVAQHLAVALSPALAQTLATFATTRHVFSVIFERETILGLNPGRAPVSNFPPVLTLFRHRVGRGARIFLYSAIDTLALYFLTNMPKKAETKVATPVAAPAKSGGKGKVYNILC